MAGKIFDVAKPGTTKPSSTSKPVIIGHKAKLDPMVSSSAIEPVASSAELQPTATAPLLPKTKTIKPKPDEKAKTAITVKVGKSDKTERVESSPALPRSSIKILPSEEEKTPESSPAATVSPAAKDDKADEQLISEIAKSADEPAKTKPKPPEPEPAEEPVEEEVTTEKDAAANSIDDAIGKPAEDEDKSKATPEAKAALAKQELVEKLIKEETYTLPIKTVTERRVRRGAIMLVFVLLVLVALYVLVDAEIIKPGFDVPFHLLKH